MLARLVDRLVLGDPALLSMVCLSGGSLARQAAGNRGALVV